MSIVLLVGAGLLLRSLAALQRVDPGLDAQGVLTLRYDPPPGRYDSTATLNVLYDELVSRLTSLPGVTAVGAANILPLSGGFNGMGFRIDARPAPRPGEEPSAETRAVTPGFLAAMGIPVVRGRGLEEGDNTGAPPVIVINRAMAEQYWAGEDPIGERITLQSASREIVGIVENVHEFSLAELPVAGMYVPQAQAPGWLRLPVLLALRTPGGDPLALAGPVRDALRQYDPNAVLSAFVPMDRIVARTLGAPRFRSLLLGIFAVIALCLGTIGVYGVVSRTVAQRRAEIGIRLSLGADRCSVTGLLLRDGMKPVALGLAIGTAAAVVLARGMASLLFSVTPADPATFAVVVALLAAIAAAACWIPAQRAARLDPVHVLRND
jgi:putative ABC transport system permease protein